MITVKTFAQIREITGQAECQIECDNPLTVQELITHLSSQNAQWTEALSGPVLIAVNQALCDRKCIVSDGDEVAFFPPVTGG